MVENNSGFSESFILGLIGALGGLVSLVFAALRKSRCENVRCCWGLAACKREVLTLEELKNEPASPQRVRVDV